MEKVCIIGGSGHAKVVADSIECMIRSGCDVEIMGFLDDNPAKSRLLNYPRLGDLSRIEELSASGVSFVIGIGDNGIRKRVDESYRVRWFSAVHPLSSVSTHASIGEGTVIMPGSVINAGATVGRHGIINSGAIVEHDCSLADYVHVSPNATLCGNVSVGEGTHIGAGATVIQNIKIGAYSVIGAGAVVVKNICDHKTVMGVPAK